MAIPWALVGRHGVGSETYFEAAGNAARIEIADKRIRVVSVGECDGRNPVTPVLLVKSGINRPKFTRHNADARTLNHGYAVWPKGQMGFRQSLNLGRCGPCPCR